MTSLETGRSLIDVTARHDPLFRLDAIRSASTLCDLFQDTVRAFPDELALRSLDGGLELTWREYGERVTAVAAGLASLGIGRGDTVALMLTNRPEFHVIDTAAYHLGAAPFSIYNTSSVEQVVHLLTNAGSRVVVCEPAFLDTVTEAAQQARVEHVVCLTSGADTADLERLGAAYAGDFDFEATWRSVRPDDLLTIIYTSGTTGPPKGVELAHRNILAVLASIYAIPEMATGMRRGRVISYLPDAHGLNRLFCHYMPAVGGTTVLTLADSKRLVDVMPDVRPTVFVAVPMLWYKLRAGVERAVAKEHGVRRVLARWALATGTRKQQRASSGDVSIRLRLAAAIANRLVLTKLASRIGLGDVRVAVTGAAPIAVETLDFVLSLGIPCCEGWGLTETTLATLNRPGAQRPGTVGTALPGVEIKLADDGELLVRSDGVMLGYRGEPERTAEMVDAEGWARTGDLGSIDENGFVTIVDRKKELLINTAGKNMSPSNIENAVRTASSLIGSVVAIGDRRHYVTALITLDPDAAEAFAGDARLPSSAEVLSHDPEVRSAVEAAVEAANARLSRVEQIKRFTLLPTYWEPASDELTPTMKLRRTPIAEKYAAEIESMYATEKER